MRPTRLALALALAMFALPLSALAQESGATDDPAQEAPADDAPAADSEEEATPNWTWNLALTTVYVFRGVTQTDYQPALQAGLDYSFGDSGWYVGAWASNVDFADSNGPDIEFDSYIGWNHDLSDTMNLDLSLVHYAYMGERNDYGSIDYTEALGALTWNEMITLNVGYAPDYANLDYSGTWVNLAGSWDLGNDFSINASVGHSSFSDDNGSYNDWNLGVSKQFGPVNAAINYYDTNLDFDAAAEHHRASDQIVFTLAFGNG
jgi:uncharacterized protein (TIGR02001 family)